MRLKLSTKLIGLFLIIGLTPFLGVGSYLYHTGGDALRQKEIERLSFAREAKKTQVVQFFDELQRDFVTLSERSQVKNGMVELTTAFHAVEKELAAEYDKNQQAHDESLRATYTQHISQTSEPPANAAALWWPRDKGSRILQHHYIAANPFPVGEKSKQDASPDASLYSQAHARYHPFYRNLIERYGYYDMLLVEPDGDVVYSLAKEIDFTSNLTTGPFANTNVARAFAAAMADAVKGNLHLVDFADYPPSRNESAGFIATALFEGNAKVGVVIIQVPIDEINDIMTDNREWRRVGMGETGESVLVGSDKLLRSKSRFFIESPDKFFEDIKVAGANDETITRIKRHKTVVGVLPYNSDDVADALAGKIHFEEDAQDYRGREVLLAHAPIDLPGGIRWALITTLERDEAFATLNHVQQVIAVMSVLGVLAVGAVGWFFARSISVPLNEVITVVSSSSTQIAASVNEQERIAAQQAASVNETNTTMEELGSSSRQSAEQAESAAGNAQKALELAEHGMSRVEDMMGGMGSAKQKVEAIAQQILRLSEQTSQIRDITGLVADFAKETKMLAMNAAVEAVRAGEHGKGFSVLSVETRKLADESKRSAERINALVSEIQKATDATVMVTEEGTKTVESSMQIAENTASTFREVADSVNSASESSQQISLNVRQQAIAMKQVVEAMKSLTAGAKESAAGISQVKTGIQTLNEAAQKLRQMV